MKRTVIALLAILGLTACARTRTYDDHRWECIKLYEGEERPVEDLALVMARQPLFVMAVRQKDLPEDETIEVDEIAERDIMLELLPDNYLVTLGYRTHNVMNETVRKGQELTVKFEAKTNHIYRVVLVEEFEQELDEEFEWCAGIQDVESEEVVTVPVLLKEKARSAALKTQEKLSQMGGINLQLVTNKQGRVEFRVPKRKK